MKEAIPPDGGVALEEQPGGRDAPAGAPATSLEVRPIGDEEFRDHVRSAETASYQQTPEWSAVRGGEWDSELVGWFDPQGRRAAVSVIRYQRLPVLGYRLAYLPMGPVVEWARVPLGEVLAALRRHLESRRVFAIRMYPQLRHRIWTSSTVRRALADSSLTHLARVEPDAQDVVAESLVNALRGGGWRELGDDEAVESTQPRFTYQVPLAGRSEDEVLAGFSKVWRKNVRSAARQGVEVRPADRGDLQELHRLHEETAARSGFTAQPRAYMEALWDQFSGDGPFPLDVDLARHDGEVFSGNVTVSVGGVAYAIIAGNSSHHRELRASNAVYWAQIQRSISRGSAAYDLGAVPPSLDADHPHAGLLQFKLGLGGEVAEGVGGWDLALRPALYAAFTTLHPLYTGASADVRRRFRPGRAGGEA